MVAINSEYTHLQIFFHILSPNSKTSMYLLETCATESHKIMHNCEVWEVIRGIHLMFPKWKSDKMRLASVYFFLSQYFWEACLAAAAGSSLLKYVSISFPHLETGFYFIFLPESYFWAKPFHCENLIWSKLCPNVGSNGFGLVYSTNYSYFGRFFF